MEATRVKLVSEDHTTEFEICQAVDIEATSGLPFVLTQVYKNGLPVGTPTRFKMAGNRLAMDTPGVSDLHFIVDGNGFITNG
jgi:hypothetical protein